MDAKSAAREGFESAREELIALSHRIHAHPELGLDGAIAMAWTCIDLALNEARSRS
jgi:hypothetical protein